MNESQSKNKIGIHFIGLQAKERALFDRVIAFNATHGLQAHVCNDLESSNLVILSESALSELEQGADKIKLVISNNASLGDVQVAAPLLITRVMKALENAITLVHEAPDQTAENETSIDTERGEIEKDQENKDSTTASAEAESIEKSEPETNQEVENEHTGHHALVIDDSAAIRKQLELELRDAGITADFAESGEMALEKIKETQFDLIFLDIIMPGIDGYETCKAMRATDEYKKTPIIMLSGKTSPLDEVQGVIAGATTYLTKPVKSNMLQETLNRVTKWIDNYSTAEKKSSATV